MTAEVTPRAGMERPTGTDAGMGDGRDPGAAGGGSGGGSETGAGAASPMEGASEYGAALPVAAPTFGRTAAMPRLARTTAAPVQTRDRPGRGASGAR
jgi:hypothetical protein